MNYLIEKRTPVVRLGDIEPGGPFRFPEEEQRDVVRIRGRRVGDNEESPILCMALFNGASFYCSPGRGVVPLVAVKEPVFEEAHD